MVIDKSGEVFRRFFYEKNATLTTASPDLSR
jgi:hypothetical protein